jgi:hypothetical protein
MVARLRLILLLAVILAPAARSQDVQATARVDSNHILIGDWLKLSLQIDHRASATISIPALPDSFEGFQVIRRDSAVVQQSGEMVRVLTGFLITSFDSGMHVIPPIPVRYRIQGDTALREAETAPIPVVVRGIAVDTAQEIKDVKPPLSLPLTLADLLPYIIALVLIGGLIWLVLYIRKKRRRGEPLLAEEPPRPPHEVALEGLLSLESERLWQRGKVKEYHSLLTDILRVYCEGRFSVMAMEMTSYEILAAAPLAALSREAKDQLAEILLRADLVKFAKFQPLPEEHEKSLALARHFVESTWRLAAEPVAAHEVSA